MESNREVYGSLASRDSRIFARVPKEIKRKLQLSAGQSGRNLTAELIARIARSLEEHPFIESMPQGLSE